MIFPLKKGKVRLLTFFFRQTIQTIFWKNNMKTTISI